VLLRALGRVVCCRLLRLALPMMLQSLALMLLTFISTTFVGHLNDPLALSAVVLSSSLYNVSGASRYDVPGSVTKVPS
jgi:Na+-driven multidrug efflux pump